MPIETKPVGCVAIPMPPPSQRASPAASAGAPPQTPPPQTPPPQTPPPQAPPQATPMTPQRRFSHATPFAGAPDWAPKRSSAPATFASPAQGPGPSGTNVEKGRRLEFGPTPGADATGAGAGAGAGAGDGAGAGGPAPARRSPRMSLDSGLAGEMQALAPTASATPTNAFSR